MSHPFDTAESIYSTMRKDALQGLGTATLALVKGNLPEADVSKARNVCISASDSWIAHMETEG
jgi:hypothetical protein